MLGYLAYRMATTPPANGPSVKRGWEILDGPYPKSWDDFIGQETAQLQIRAALVSALRRQEPVDHILLASGQPGIGKSAMSRLVAHDIGGGFVELGGTVSDRDAVKALKAMQDGDVLFLDEVHRLVSHGKARAEWLLTLLQDGTIQTPGGAVEAPAITVIAATTDAQRLPQTILDRFPLKPILEAYTLSEATRIAKVAAYRLGFGTPDAEGKIALPMPDSSSWLERVAKASDNNPRRMGVLLTAVRDVAIATELSNLDGDEGYDIDLALKWNGLTEDGLTRGAQDYMLALWSYGGTAGASTLKAALAEEQVGHTEKLLIQKGYMTVTPRGRELTDYGHERARELAKEAIAAHAAREKEHA